MYIYVYTASAVMPCSICHASVQDQSHIITPSQYTGPVTYSHASQHPELTLMNAMPIRWTSHAMQYMPCQYSRHLCHHTECTVPPLHLSWIDYLQWHNSKHISSLPRRQSHGMQSRVFIIVSQGITTPYSSVMYFLKHLHIQFNVLHILYQDCT